MSLSGRPARVLRALVAAALALPLAAGCAQREQDDPDGVVRLWSHGGTAAERAALDRVTAEFERRHPRVDVVVTIVAEGDYTTALLAAAAAHELPDVVDVDGPLVASLAEVGALAPLDDLLDDDVRQRLLPTLRAQGTWHGRLWAAGAFDSGLGLWADRAALVRAGVRVPSGVADAWTAAELDRALAALARRDPDGKVLDLKLGYGQGEWLTYGFAPLLASAGGDLRDLASPANERALATLARWRRHVDPDPTGTAFVERRVPLSWVGHWTYAEYAAALGEDLVLLPLPDLGAGSRTGSGSWAWGVSARSDNPQAAAALLAHLLADPSVLTVTQANGAIPGTTSALAQSPRHAPGGPLHLYVEQRDAGATVPRPVTPDYAALTAAFSTAVSEVLEGAAPREALARAAAALA